MPPTKPNQNKGKKKVLSSDAQWCLDNISTLTTKNFYERFADDYKDMKKVSYRYKNILNHDLKGIKNIVKIREEYESWVKSGESIDFLLKKVRDETSSFAHIQGAEYFQDVVRSEVEAVRRREGAASSNSNTNSNYINNEQEATVDNNFRGSNSNSSRAFDQGSSHNTDISPWLLNNGVNVTDLFFEYFRSVKSLIHSKNQIAIETHVQELACLNHVLVLKPFQHTKMMRECFTDQVLNHILTEQAKKCIDQSIDFTDEEYITISNIIKMLSTPGESIYKLATDLMILANSLTYEKRRVIIGVSSLLLKLPRNPIVNVTAISETEIWSLYFDPMLSILFSDSERGTILRWLNKLTEDDLVRPDATITLIDQLEFRANLGFGEVKIANLKCNKAALCLDFLRLTHLTKECIDSNYLDGSFSFQIHGFYITFYMTRLDHHKIYTITELGKIQFPKSPNDLSSFCCAKNLQLLAQITSSFWKTCKVSEDPQSVSQRSSASNGIGLIQAFIDPRKNRDRDCSDFFGY